MSQLKSNQAFIIAETAFTSAAAAISPLHPTESNCEKMHPAQTHMYALVPFQVHAHGFAFAGLMSFPFEWGPFEWGQLNGGIFAMLLPTTYCLCKILSLTIGKPMYP